MFAEMKMWTIWRAVCVLVDVAVWTERAHLAAIRLADRLACNVAKRLDAIEARKAGRARS